MKAGYLVKQLVGACVSFAILGLSFLVTIAVYVVAGIDSGRYHWSPGFPLLFGSLCCILPSALLIILLIPAVW